MTSIFMVVLIGLLINIPSLIPVLFLKKVSRNIKVSIAIRIFILNIFLVFSLVTLTNSITEKYSTFPLWVTLMAVVCFGILLISTISYIRKFLSIGISRAIILSSFMIVYVVRVQSVFADRINGGYTINGSSAVWTFFFMLACLLAYLSCAGKKNFSGTYTSSVNNQVHPYKTNKEYEMQSQIDYDIAIKGRSVLSDPTLSIIEQKRYRDALEEKEKDTF
ncbi:hypothetical protein O3S68_22220 [Kosakonia sp. SOY2]|uniref:hypothetical protein n=1 Tax=Kosakonia sp. SOY2 TaxID=3014557 RepID=UPI0022AC67A5|nr:hypothetical protein [Kosakonia sp. SOY2]MCZ3384992.1 hypothetical protein [Kosakonia sp. SOY2]